MGKGARVRGGRQAQEEATRRLDELGGERLRGERADPAIAAIEATGPEGVTAREGAEELLSSARAHGCTCQNPGFSVQDLGDKVGHLRMHHDENCPLMRSIQEGPG